MPEPKTAEVKVEWNSHNPRYGGNFPPVKPDQWVMVRGNMIEDPRGPVLAGDVYWGDREDCDNPVRWYTLTPAPASPPAETGEGERPCTCHPDEAPMPCAKRYALTDCLSAQPVSPSEGPHGYLVKDFADGWFWTPDASLACADGAAVWSLERARYETEAHPASDQSDTERMRAALKRAKAVLENTAVSNALRMVGAHEIIDAALAEKAADQCDLPPEGWSCTRPKGHENPCAAIPKEDRS